MSEIKTRAFIPRADPRIALWLVRDYWTEGPVLSGYAEIVDGKPTYPLDRTRRELQLLPDTPTLLLTYDEVEAFRDELMGWKRP